MQNSIVTVDANLWEAVSRILLAPIAWIVGMQKWFLDFFLSSSSGWAAAGKLIFLLLPVLLFVAAAGVGGRSGGVLMLVAFLVGLLVSNSAIALASTFGFLRATRPLSAWLDTNVGPSATGSTAG